MNAAARSTLLGAGAGATLMFMLDPARGARRRALVRDKAVWIGRKTRDAAGATRRDVGNRLYGLQSRARSLFTEDMVDEATIVERVRAALGRLTSHTGAISVSAMDGTVTLSGDAFASEVPWIVSTVKRVRGVERVENNLTAHASAEGIPALQGGMPRSVNWLRRVGGTLTTPTSMLATAAFVLAAVVAAKAGRMS